MGMQILKRLKVVVDSYDIGYIVAALSFFHGFLKVSIEEVSRAGVEEETGDQVFDCGVRTAGHEMVLP